METVRSRYRKTLAGEKPSDRLPVMEWAHWWDLTVKRWREEGLPEELDTHGIKRYFGLDMDYQIWFSLMLPDAPVKKPGCYVEDEVDYDALLPYLYPEHIEFDREVWKQRAVEQEAGDAVIWFSLTGPFWWPRVLFGIEPHLFAFYDKPDLMKRMNEDLLRYSIRLIEVFCSEITTPDFMTFAEDMSYNHGPMVSEDMFDEFMAPYYVRIIPELKKRGIVTIIDSDGGIEPLIPWFERVGLDGILPLERMAGVDVNRIRANHPKWKMIGGFDKTVMHLGEEAIRKEFERLLPAMRSGRFIPSVDHQTPPAVSMKDYRLYLKLLREYTEAAVQRRLPEGISQSNV